MATIMVQQATMASSTTCSSSSSSPSSSSSSVDGSISRRERWSSSDLADLIDVSVGDGDVEGGDVDHLHQVTHGRRCDNSNNSLLKRTIVRLLSLRDENNRDSSGQNNMSTNNNDVNRFASELMRTTPLGSEIDAVLDELRSLQLKFNENSNKDKKNTIPMQRLIENYATLIASRKIEESNLDKIGALLSITGRLPQQPQQGVDGDEELVQRFQGLEDSYDLELEEVHYHQHQHLEQAQSSSHRQRFRITTRDPLPETLLHATRIGLMTKSEVSGVENSTLSSSL